MDQDWLLLTCLYCMLQVFGVLPIKWNKHINHDLHLCGQEKDCFSVNLKRKVATVLQLMIFIQFGCKHRLFPWHLHIPNLNSIVWNANSLSAICCLFLVLFHQPKELSFCCSMACKIYTLTSKNNKIPLCLSILLIVYPLITIIYLILAALIYNMSLKKVFLIFESNYEYTPIACIELIVILMCLISSRSFTDINRKFQKMKRCNKKNFKCLIGLLKNQLFISKFVNRFVEHFSVHFLNMFTIYVVQMISYAVILIQSTKRLELLNALTFCIHGLYITGRIFFLCFCCQQVKIKWNDTMKNFRRIRMLWVEDISHEQKELLDGYEELILCSKIKFTACGLFPIDLNQTLSVLGLIVTYTIVALQNN